MAGSEAYIWRYMFFCVSTWALIMSICIWTGSMSVMMHGCPNDHIILTYLIQ